MRLVCALGTSDSKLDPNVAETAIVLEQSFIFFLFHFIGSLITRKWIITSNSCECMGVIGDALQLDAVHKKPYFFFYYKSKSISVL